MMKKILAAFLIATLTFASTAFAAEASKLAAAVSTPMPSTTAAATASTDASGVPALFQKPVALRGSLGDVEIQVNIRPKPEADEGHEGDYFIFGSANKILLAGEVAGDMLFMEESENGTDISGQWDGKLEGDTLAGTWMSPDGSITKPFSLKVVPQSQKQTSTKTGQKGVASKP